MLLDFRGAGISRFVIAVLLLASLAVSPCLSAGVDPSRSLPPRDSDDLSPMSPADRLLIRAMIPDLPTSGPYQYPNWAPRYVEWLKHGVQAGTGDAGADFVVTSNVNVSNDPVVQSETYIAADFYDPRFVIAASNDFSGAQRTYSSSDAGKSWTTIKMPTGGFNFQSDPGVAFDSLGNAYTCTLGINPGVRLIVSKSTDRGRTWGVPVEVPGGANNDKELMSIDSQATSPCRDNIYLGWDVPGQAMKFSRSTDGGATYSNPVSIDKAQGIGASLSSGPGGEVYVAWNALDKTIKGARSLDCGATFEPAFVIGPTNQPYDIGIPGMCNRRALVYPALDVDRSFGCRSGWVYVAWVDSVAPGNCKVASCPATQTCSTDIFFSRSSDRGATWTAPKRANQDVPLTDQFNPWLATDPADGSVWIAWDDSRNDPNRQSCDIYITRSVDGGETFAADTRVTTEPTNESGAGAEIFNQWGDYNGLAASSGKIYAIWTDRRAGGTNGGKEEAYVGTIEAQADGCPVGNLDGGYPIGLN